MHPRPDQPAPVRRKRIRWSLPRRTYPQRTGGCRPSRTASLGLNRSRRNQQDSAYRLPLPSAKSSPVRTLRTPLLRKGRCPHALQHTGGKMSVRWACTFLGRRLYRLSLDRSQRLLRPESTWCRRCCWRRHTRHGCMPHKLWRGQNLCQPYLQRTASKTQFDLLLNTARCRS